MAADPVVAPRPRPYAPTRPRLRPAPPPRRRVSGPARHRRPARPAPTTPLGRLLDGIRAVGDSRLLDRLIRGQGWVVVLGIALMGIVFLQVSLLKLNTGIGQSIERAGALERENADLRAEVSDLSSEERIQSVAEKQGLLMPDAGEVRYVSIRGEIDARKAAAVMRPPDPPEETAATTTTTDPAAGATATAADPAAAATTPAPEAQTTPPPAQTTPPPATQTAPATSGATDAGATAAPTAATAAPGQ